MIILLKSLVVWVLAGAVGRLLLGAGLALVTHVWVSGAIVDALNYLTTELLGFPGASILWMSGIGEALTIIGTALVARAYILSMQTILVKS